MALRLKNGAIFLHIPKTGGNWITKVLYELDLVDRPISHKHSDIDHTLLSPKTLGRKSTIRYALQELLYPRKKKPYLFCFVRNPLSWYESWFKYMSQPSRQWRRWGSETDIYDWHPNAILNGLGSDNFNTFVRNVMQERPGYVSELYGWYTKPEIDFVGKQENLVNDLIQVLKEINIDFDEQFVRNYGKVGVSPTPVAKVIWQEKLRKQVALCEYAGLLRYDYHQTLKELHLDIDTVLKMSS